MLSSAGSDTELSPWADIVGPCYSVDSFSKALGLTQAAVLEAAAGLRVLGLRTADAHDLFPSFQVRDGRVHPDGVAPAINIDDRTLRHLRAVIVTELRRDESFSFTWDAEPAGHGDDALEGKRGRWGTIWISKSSSLYFALDSEAHGPLNQNWLKAMADDATGAIGLRPIPEP